MALCPWLKENIECKHPATSIKEKMNQLEFCRKCKEEMKGVKNE